MQLASTHSLHTAAVLVWVSTCQHGAAWRVLHVPAFPTHSHQCMRGRESKTAASCCCLSCTLFTRWLLAACGCCAGQMASRHEETFTRAGGNGDYITRCVVEACRAGGCDINDTVSATAAMHVYKMTSHETAGEDERLCCQRRVDAQHRCVLLRSIRPLTCSARMAQQSQCSAYHAPDQLVFVWPTLTLHVPQPLCCRATGPAVLVVWAPWDRVQPPDSPAAAGLGQAAEEYFSKSQPAAQPPPPPPQGQASVRSSLHQQQQQEEGEAGAAAAALKRCHPSSSSATGRGPQLPVLLPALVHSRQPSSSPRWTAPLPCPHTTRPGNRAQAPTRHCWHRHCWHRHRQQQQQPQSPWQACWQACSRLAHQHRQQQQHHSPWQICWASHQQGLLPLALQDCCLG